MFTGTLPSFWFRPVQSQPKTKPPKPRGAPVFIGDAVQPLGSDTLLLTLLRQADEISGDDKDPY